MLLSAIKDRKISGDLGISLSQTPLPSPSLFHSKLSISVSFFFEEELSSKSVTLFPTLGAVRLLMCGRSFDQSGKPGFC